MAKNMSVLALRQFSNQSQILYATFDNTRSLTKSVALQYYYYKKDFIYFINIRNKAWPSFYDYVAYNT